MKQIETERLILRQVKHSDALPLFHMIYHNPNVLKTFLAQYMSDPSEATVDNLIRYQNSGKLIYILEIRQTGEVIGMLLEQDQNAGSIELGYAIGEPYWNQGYTTEAMKAVIQYLAYLQYTRITAQCFQENTASAKVMQNCGMKQTSSSYSLLYNNENHLVIEYELLL